MAVGEERGNGRRGRPRDPAVEQSILEAAIRTLAAEGVDRMSMDKVAAESGVSKVTIYSRYPSKSALVGAALAHLRVADVPAPTGDTAADLAALLEHMIQQYDRVGGLGIVGSCLASEPRSPHLLELIRTNTLLPRRRYFLDVLEVARDRGELRAGIDLDEAVSVLVGSFYAEHLAGRRRDAGWARRIVDLVLRGLAVRPARSGESDRRAG